MTSGAKADGRIGEQDFVYSADEDVYRCPAGEKLTYRFTAEEQGQKLRRYWADACGSCPIKAQCTTSKQRRMPRWEHEGVVEAVQERLDKKPAPCARAVRRSSTVRYKEDADECNELPDEDAAEGRHRDGPQCPGLQSYLCTEHRRHRAADGGSQGVTRPDFRSVRPQDRSRRLRRHQLALRPKSEKDARNRYSRFVALQPALITEPARALSHGQDLGDLQWWILAAAHDQNATTWPP